MRSAPAAGATEETYTIQLRKGSAQVRFATRGLVDRSIVDQIWVRDTYGVRATSRPPGLVVDIGAHIGAFTIMAAKAWPDARIVAAEADPENAALLRSNLSGCRNVEIVEAVIVGDNLKDVQFHRVVDKTNHNSGGGSCKRDEPGSEPVRLPAMSAVELWQSRQLTRCGLFKLDCEGAEVDVLRELADEGLLHGVEHIVGEWHSDVPTEPSRETTKAQLKRILRATHHLAFLPHGTGREGHFFATLRTISDVGTSSPADSGSTAGDNAAQ
jgi:FkbM family methyltransferase